MLYFIALISNKTIYINIFIIFGIVTLIIISICYLIIYLMEQIKIKNKKADAHRRAADILKLAEENATNLQDVLETLPPVDDNTKGNVENQQLPSWMESHNGVSLPHVPTLDPTYTHTRPISRRPSSQTDWDNMVDIYTENRDDDIPWHSQEDATTRPVTTPVVTTRPVTTPAVTTRPVTTPAVTTRPVTTPAVTSRPVTTPASTQNCQNVARIGTSCITGWKCRENTWHCDRLDEMTQ